MGAKGRVEQEGDFWRWIIRQDGQTYVDGGNYRTAEQAESGLAEALRALTPGEARPSTVPALRCRCARCGHQWTTTDDEAPASCPGCKSKSWRTAAGTVRLGRPPKG